MGLMTYGAQIVAGVGSLWNNCHLPLGFPNITLWRQKPCLVDFNGWQITTKGILVFVILNILTPERRSLYEIFLTIAILFQSVPIADTAPSPRLTHQPVRILLSPGHHLVDIYRWHRFAVGFMALGSGVNGLSTALLWMQPVKREKIWSDLITKSQKQGEKKVVFFFFLVVHNLQRLQELRYIILQ